MAIDIIFTIVLLILAVVLHECAHGLVAYWLGDPTAKMAGRLTLNPIKHVDPVGTIILPGMLILLKAPFLFGWAKPVPVNFMRLRSPKRDMMWVALAGPAVNFILAAIFAYLIRFNIFPGLHDVFIQGIFLNLLLAVFNLLPIPPLDGGRVLMSVLPDPLSARLAGFEQIGMLVVFGLLYLGVFDKIIFPIIKRLASMLLGTPIL